MLVIRLFRTGRTNQPSFKVVVTEKSNAPSRGRFVEEVGFYNPLTKERRLNAERIRHWLSVGAQASGTVHNMLVAERVVEGEKVAKHKAAKKEEAAQTPSGKLPGEKAPTAEAAETAEPPAAPEPEPKAQEAKEQKPEEQPEQEQEAEERQTKGASEKEEKKEAA